MKKIVLILLATTFLLPVMAQKSQVIVTGGQVKSETVVTMADQAALKIFPVPVRENNFTVTSVSDITMIRITNIIGQEVFKTKYSNPVLSTQVNLKNPQRGMYLVTITFTDNSRAVRKIMVETL
jgi:hypothetical protein